MKIIDKSDIIEEYERIKQAEQDQISLRQDVDSNNIRSADRIEDLLCFPIDAQKDLRKTDRIYMTDDNRRLLLIREYGDMRSSESMNSTSITVTPSQKITNSTTKSEKTIPINKSMTRIKRETRDSDHDNGYVIDFKVFVDDDQDRTHQIHVQANCPDFSPKHLYINGIKFSQEL